MKKYLLFDIGGTSIKVATYSDKLSDIQEYPTDASLGAKKIIDRICSVVNEKGKIDAIGICTAGQVDYINGTIIYANENIPGYTGTKWKNILEEKYNIPVFVENDVNCVALGEGKYGVAKNRKNYLCLTYGTGIGGAIVINGELYHGASNVAGEFGSILINSKEHIKGNPFSGGYEKYASTTALIEMAKKIDPTLNSGRTIFSRANEDKVKIIINDWTKQITYGLVSLIHIFNPETIILGGGVMEQESLFKLVNDLVMDEIMVSFKNVRIVKAKLGNKAGLYGILSIIEKNTI